MKKKVEEERQKKYNTTLDNQQPIAVISGDIIRSTDLSTEQYDDLLEALKGLLNFVVSHHPQNKFEISRGDFFQLVIHDSENAAKYALLIRTGLKQRNDSFDCRISIGIGSGVDSQIVLRNSIGSSTGDAFTLSGRALETIGSSTLKVTTDDKQFNEFFSLLTQYLDHQISEMTLRQCAIIHILLKEEKQITQGEIAEKLGAKRVSINRSMKSANVKRVIEYTVLFSKKVREAWGSPNQVL